MFIYAKFTSLNREILFMMGDDRRVDESGLRCNRGDRQVPDDIFSSSHIHHTSSAW